MAKNEAHPEARSTPASASPTSPSSIVRDLVTETQTRLAGVQKDVTARVADVQKTAVDPKALADRASTVVSARVDALAKDAKARRVAIEARVAELQAEAALPGKVQKPVDDNVDAATDTYADLVKRGESLVGRIRRQESTKATVASAKTTGQGQDHATQATQGRRRGDHRHQAHRDRSQERQQDHGQEAPAKKSTTKAAASKAPPRRPRRPSRPLPSRPRRRPPPRRRPARLRPSRPARRRAAPRPP